MKEKIRGIKHNVLGSESEENQNGITLDQQNSDMEDQVKVHLALEEEFGNRLIENSDFSDSDQNNNSDDTENE